MTNVIKFERPDLPRKERGIEALVYCIHDAMEMGMDKDEFLKCIDELWDGVIAEEIA